MNSVQRFKAEVLADKRKAALLGGLGVVAVALSARAVFLSGERKPEPDAAPAAIEQVSHIDTAAEAEQRIRELMMHAGSTAQVSYPERDIFALGEAHFPQPTEPEPPVDESAKLAEQTDEVSDQPSEMELAAASLTLKSTLVGKRPVAVLSVSGLGGARDEVVRVGDRVSGFSVVAIEAKRVVLEYDGERIALVVIDPLQK